MVGHAHRISDSRYWSGLNAPRVSGNGVDAT